MFIVHVAYLVPVYEILSLETVPIFRCVTDVAVLPLGATALAENGTDLGLGREVAKVILFHMKHQNINALTFGGKKGTWFIERPSGKGLRGPLLGVLQGYIGTADPTLLWRSAGSFGWSYW